MKNLVGSVFILLAVSFLHIETAYSQAQCFLDDKNALKACVDTEISSCRAAEPLCNKYEPVLSIKDVRTIAIANCCNKTRRAARALCLAKEANKYIFKVNSGAQRDFFRAARQNINDVKRNVCKTSSYSLPASALF
jgi:hypothetical protein